VPDEFPTLEVVALIGVIVAVVRTWQLRVALAEMPELGKELEAALRAGDLRAARSLCARTEGAAFARVGSAVVDRLARSPAATASELTRIVRDAMKRATLAVQRKRGRDLVVAAVLIGAAAYAVRTDLGVSQAFYTLLGLALLVTALGPILRRSTLTALSTASDSLLSAALSYRSPRAGAESGPCLECGSSEAVELTGEGLGGLERLGVEAVRVCRECGALRGRAKDPASIVLDAAHGIREARALPSSEGAADPESEHQG
jgi:hypothetical protein